MCKPLLQQTSTIRNCNYSMQMPKHSRDIDLCESRESCQLAPSDNKKHFLTIVASPTYTERARSENTASRNEPNYFFRHFEPSSYILLVN